MAEGIDQSSVSLLAWRDQLQKTVMNTLDTTAPSQIADLYRLMAWVIMNRHESSLMSHLGIYGLTTLLLERQGYILNKLDDDTGSS